MTVSTSPRAPRARPADACEPDPVVDLDGLASELDALRAEVERDLGPEDLAHLEKLERWGRALTALGYATAWIAPNPLSAWCIGHGAVARWTMMAHHVLHRGYDRVPGVPARFTSEGFAAGARRLLDWPDWLLPEAWKHEHNQLHHYRTSERADPDLVEENVQRVREADLPVAVKYLVVAFYALTWKFTYYAPSTFQVLRKDRQRRGAAARGAGAAPATDEPYLAAYDLRAPAGREFWRRCVLPYGLLRFVVVPALFGVLGPWAAFSVWVNSVLAELLGNAYSFLLIAPNHAGEDLYRFDVKASGRGEFYARQILSSVNFDLGNDRVDFLHGFLNYQIEHHLFPDLPMRQYRKVQPRVRALCEKYGLPYVQEPVLTRAARLVDVMVGKASMRRAARVARPAAALAGAPE